MLIAPDLLALLLAAAVDFLPPALDWLTSPPSALEALATAGGFGWTYLRRGKTPPSDD